MGGGACTNYPQVRVMRKKRTSSKIHNWSDKQMDSKKKKNNKTSAFDFLLLT